MPLWNWLMETQDMPKELRLFYFAFLTVWLYILLKQFIIFQVNLPTLYHQVPSSFILVFKRLLLKFLNILTLLTLMVVLIDHPTRLATILTIFNSDISRTIFTEKKYFCPNCLWTLKTNSLSTCSSAFRPFLYHHTKTNINKRTHGGSPIKSPWIGIALPYLSLDQGKKNPRGPTTDVSKFTPGFMLQMDSAFFNIESILDFTSTFLDICSANSYIFGFPSRSKRPPLDIMKFLVTILINQDKEVAFVRVDEDGRLARSS